MQNEEGTMLTEDSNSEASGIRPTTRRELLKAAGTTALGILVVSLLPENAVHAQADTRIRMHIPIGLSIAQTTNYFSVKADNIVHIGERAQIYVTPVTPYTLGQLSVTSDTDFGRLKAHMPTALGPGVNGVVTFIYDVPFNFPMLSKNITLTLTETVTSKPVGMPLSFQVLLNGS